MKKYKVMSLEITNFNRTNFIEKSINVYNIFIDFFAKNGNTEFHKINEVIMK